MDRLAGNYLSNGDVANASSLYNSLERLNPNKYSRMARICRVLSDPQSVPLPFRSDDICEALLDPAVPPELLLRSCAGDVQKSFQRLAVCVHPDKNPNARAKDAFLRLTHMKDRALQLLHDKTGVSGESGADGASAAQQPNGKAAAPTGSGVRRPQRPPLAGAANSGAAPLKKRAMRHTTPPLTPVTGLQAAGNVATKLDHLRHTTIKLNCFKRRDIADDFEIFSATQRHGGGSSETSLTDYEVEQLAATVPVLPLGRRAPLSRRQPPLRSVGKKPLDGPHRLATPLPVPSPDASVGSPSGTPPVASPVVVRPSPLSPPTLAPLGEAVAHRSSSGGGGCGEEKKDAAAGGSPRPVSAALVHGDDAIRQQIDQTCLQLREMRSFTTNIKLTLDLSFEAYQRSKQAP